MSFDSLWNCYEMGLSEEQPHFCMYAQQFRTWAESFCGNIVQSPTLVSINQAKVLLIDKYFEWRAVVPKRHRALVSGNHVCIFQVFEQTYGQLRTIELSLTPPMLFVPQPPATPSSSSPPQIAGIFLGELEE